MAGRYERLIASVNAIVKQNNNQEITGTNLQNVLDTVIATVGEYAAFAGIATKSTVPAEPDGKVFYIAVESGVYTSFGRVMPVEALSIIYNLESGGWAVKPLNNVQIDSLLKSLTLITGNLNTVEGRLDANGNIVASPSGIKTSPLISVIPGQTVLAYGYSSDTTPLMCTYNKEGRFLRNYMGLSFDEIFFQVEIEPETAFIRACGLPGKFLLIDSAIKDVTDLSDKIVVLEGRVNSLFSEDVDYSNKPLTDGYLIDFETGYQTPNAQGITAVTDFIPCYPNSIIQVSMLTGSNAHTSTGIAFYDANKKFMSGFRRPTRDDIERNIQQYIVPTNAAYFRTTYFNLANRVIYGNFSCHLLLNRDNFDTIQYDERELNDGYVIDEFGRPKASPVSASTSPIYCLGALELRIRIQSDTAASPTDLGIAFYQNDTFIGYVPRLKLSKGARYVTVVPPSNADNFRACYWNIEGSGIYGKWDCKLTFPKGALGYGKYRPYLYNHTYYQLMINQSVPRYWDTGTTAIDSEVLKPTTGVLLLPTSYEPEGKPTPIIMYCHGMSRNVAYGIWGDNDESFLNQKQRWAQAGFAVFDVNGQNSNGGRAINTSGCPQAVSAYRKAFEYIRQYYNVEDTVHVVGGSMGGMVALNYCMTYNNVSGLALISAWTDLYNCSWLQGVRDVFVKYYGFNDEITYENEKVQGYDFLRRTVDSDESVMPSFRFPIRYWLGSLETGSKLAEIAMNRTIPALQKGGNNVFLRIINGKGHEIVSGGSEIVDTEIALYFKRL